MLAKPGIYSYTQDKFTIWLHWIIDTIQMYQKTMAGCACCTVPHFISTSDHICNTEDQHNIIHCGSIVGPTLTVMTHQKSRPLHMYRSRVSIFSGVSRTLIRNSWEAFSLIHNTPHVAVGAPGCYMFWTVLCLFLDYKCETCSIMKCWMMDMKLSAWSG